ncbi:hypothetical protein PR202_gb23426 [Eleusine coracana subsp. coracana]|uniref:3'-5' exonuclease domain-containing protein n=1 Tax=Eleusine coracana subsp. coracana TaxID=191504 RepID=A0AAV5FJX0_ELECO|nr:hypothetical protein PR202_gb23426 [Eleusine coracana subsp. coracana]
MQTHIINVKFHHHNINTTVTSDSSIVIQFLEEIWPNEKPLLIGLDTEWLIIPKADCVNDEPNKIAIIQIGGDIHRLSIDHNISVARTSELQDTARDHLKQNSTYGLGLKNVSQGVLGLTMAKHSDDGKFHQNWGDKDLNSLHINYATIDACVSYMLGQIFNIKP